MEGGRRLDSGEDSASSITGNNDSPFLRLASLAFAHPRPDWIDPCSGLPMKTQSQVIYDEVASHAALLKYSVSSAGGCKVMLHDRWGEGGYPATLILSGTDDQVRKTLAVIREKFGSASS